MTPRPQGSSTEYGRRSPQPSSPGGKNLTDIYITHGHPDHWFGASVLLDRFPGARIVALPGVVHRMLGYLAPEALSLWQRRFPGQIPGNLTVAAELGREGIELEGHELIPVSGFDVNTSTPYTVSIASTGQVLIPAQTADNANGHWELISAHFSRGPCAEACNVTITDRLGSSVTVTMLPATY